MTAYNNHNALWDLSLPPSLPSLADDDFIALLQKQFGVNNDAISKLPNKPIIGNINPQALTGFSLSVSTPSLSDDSPSPPSAHDMSRSRRHSGIYGSQDDHNDDDPALKRKASEDFDDEPSPKAQHTGSSKKASSSRRKSSGNSNTDETRLVKRKEQNRAAQRAFRERKEKHVKDLEDKVAALEDKNSVVSAENDTLRDVIAHLQNENMRLRETAFTFSMPSSSTMAQPQKDPVPSRSSPTARSQDSPHIHFIPGPSSATSSTTPSSQASPQSLFVNEKTDTNSLAFFNPNGLSLIDPDPQQHTATADAMGMDFGFGAVPADTPYKTIASNPLFMSFREPTPFTTGMDVTPAPSGYSSTPSSAHHPSGSFDFSQQNMGSWHDVNMHDNTHAFDLTNSLDELFGGAYMGNQGPIDFTGFRSPSTNSLSPVSHRNSKSPQSSASTGASPNPQASQTTEEAGKSCPKTKAELANFIAKDTGSIFVPQPSPTGEVLPCTTGVSLPKTEKSDKNVEVLSAWNSITTNPKFKDLDINELCAEFAEKARCDGCKVVIEPAGMQQILHTVSKKVQQQQQQQQQM